MGILKKWELRLAEGDPESISSGAGSGRDAWCSWVKAAALFGCQLEARPNPKTVPRRSPAKPEFGPLGSMMDLACRAWGCARPGGVLPGVCLDSHRPDFVHDAEVLS